MVLSRPVVTLIGLVSMALFVGCGGGSDRSPASPSQSVNISGSWLGSGESTVTRNSFSARATFAQAGTSLSGTWSTISGLNGPNSGSLSGTVSSGGAISIVLTPSDPRTCTFTVTMNLENPGRMAGSYASRQCTVSDSGPIRLLKE